MAINCSEGTGKEGRARGCPQCLLCLLVCFDCFFLKKKKRIDCTELTLKNSDEQFEGLWVKNKGKANKGSLVFGVRCKPP